MEEQVAAGSQFMSPYGLIKFAGFCKWGYSSVGRAPALQAGGQGFESLYLHDSHSIVFSDCQMGL